MFSTAIGANLRLQGQGMAIQRCRRAVFTTGFQGFQAQFERIDPDRGRCFRQVCNSGDRGSDVWGWENDGRQIALLCLAQSTAFMDVTDGESPVFLGYLPNPRRPRASPSSRATGATSK